MIRLDAIAGTLELLVGANELAQREAATADLAAQHVGLGRELFAVFRHVVGSADTGASIFGGLQ
jgi:phosphogluconate dehydratase